MCSLGCPSPGTHSPRFTAPHPLRHTGIPTIFQSPAHSSLKWPTYPPGNVPYVTAGKHTLWGCLSLATGARAAYCSTPVPTQPQLPEQSTRSSWRAQCTPAWRRQSHRGCGCELSDMRIGQALGFRAQWPRDAWLSVLKTRFSSWTPCLPNVDHIQLRVEMPEQHGSLFVERAFCQAHSKFSTKADTL